MYVNIFLSLDSILEIIWESKFREGQLKAQFNNENCAYESIFIQLLPYLVY